MIIWVDADACPRDSKDLVFRMAVKRRIQAILVANSQMATPRSELVTLTVVPGGFNEADDYIVEQVQPGDLVITADIPLGARIVDRGALGLDPRGKVFDPQNVKERLATRNLMAELREGGMMGGGPPPYKPRDRSQFASALDRLLTQLLKAEQEN